MDMIFEKQGDNVNSIKSLLFALTLLFVSIGQGKAADDYNLLLYGTLYSGWSCTGGNGATVTTEESYLEFSSLIPNAQLVCTNSGTAFSTSGYTTLMAILNNSDVFGSAGDISFKLYDSSGTELTPMQVLSSYMGATLRTNEWQYAYMPLLKWGATNTTISKIVIQVPNSDSPVQVLALTFSSADVPDPYPVSVYNESLFYGWSLSSDNETIDPDACTNTSCDNRAVGIHFTTAGGTATLATTGSGASGTVYDSIYFEMQYVYADAATNVQIGLITDNIHTPPDDPAVFVNVNEHCNDTYDMPGSLPLPFSSGYWTSCAFRIPLAMLGVEEGQTVYGIVFKNAATTHDYLHFDNIRFEDGPSTGGYIRFPLKTSFSGTTLTPYNTRVVAIEDHNDDGDSSTTGDANSIVAYNGEIGTAATGSTLNEGVYGFKKVGGGNFLLPFFFDGVSHTYDDKVDSDMTYLFYEDSSGNGHRGYDFAPFPSTIDGVDVRAAEYGTLCIASDNTSYDGTNVWRDTSHCPLYRVPDNQWSKYHATYIIHDKGEFGIDSCSSYNHYLPFSSWYLHMADIDSTTAISGTTEKLRDLIVENGYARVRRGQVIGQVSNYDTDATIGSHLHFGLRRGCDLYDPYGPGTGDSSGNIPSNFRVLWEVPPPQ